QADLVIQAEEISIEKAPDLEGFHLFIKKKPGISSVLLAESTQDPLGEEDSYTYRALEWNPINGDELRLLNGSPIQNQGCFLMDSSPEYHPRLGEAFHIYIPPIVTYGYPGTRRATLTVEDGLFINIRTFSLPYCDYTAGFKDNPFTLSIQQVPEDIPFPLPEWDPRSGKPTVHPGPGAPEPLSLVIQLIPPDAPVPVQDAPADLPATLKTDQHVPITQAPAPAPLPDSEDPRILEEILSLLKAGPPAAPQPGPAEPRPKQKTPVFAPSITARGGLAIFFPGPEGVDIGLRNTYDPIGTITLTNKFTPAWGFHLGFDRDPLIMNRVFARATWDMSFIGLEAGPYFGLFNSSSGQVSPGLSLVLHVRIPRWSLFSSFQYDTTLGKDLIGPGDYIQSYSEIKAGAVLPFGRLTLSMIDRNSTAQNDLGFDIINHWIRYNLAMEIALLPLPWGFRVDLGYQRLHWTYYVSSGPLDYGYDDVYAGLELSYRIGYLTLLLGLEAPLYPFVYPLIQSIEYPQAPFFGQILLGFKWFFPPL
ncbi:MAG: hypothetical protein LBB80_09230, partial [Treponema sp.]|nr:hypothetical protein [Treponema sp.]